MEGAGGGGGEVVEGRREGVEVDDDGGGEVRVAKKVGVERRRLALFGVDDGLLFFRWKERELGSVFAFLVSWFWRFLSVPLLTGASCRDR